MSRSSQTMRIDIPPDLKEELRHSERGTRVAPAQQPAPASPRPSKEYAHIGDTDFQELFQSVYDGAIITNPDGMIVDANTRATDFLQRSRAELCERNLITLISGADSSTIQTLQASMENDRFVLIQAYCARKDGALFPVEIAINRLHARGNVYFCCFIRDVTWRRQAEEMLRTVHNAIQNASTGIAIADLKGLVNYVNHATLKLWGAARKEELLGRELRSLIPDAEQASSMVQAVLSGQRWSGEIILPQKDGPPLHIRVSAAENRDTDEELVGMVLSFHDLSDRKRAEEAEKRAERQRIMMESIGAACHHLGQPATVLLASLELLMRKRDTDSSLNEELLKSSVEAAESLRTMLHQLNDIAEYRTTPYIEGRTDAGYEGARILAVKEEGNA